LIDDKGNLRICFDLFLYPYYILADYGESRFFSKATKMRTRTRWIDTYMYMAPELVAEEERFVYLIIIIIVIILGNFFLFRKEYGFECDRWSLAMILFELMESTHPFDGKNDLQVGMKVQKGEVKSLCSKRPEQLVALYNSLQNMVFIYMHRTYIFFLLVGFFEPI
jgi:serine/threonine protein kinase